MSRKHEQAEVIYRLGQLCGPAEHVLRNPGSYDSEEKTRVAARFFAECHSFLQSLRKFTLGEPGHDYIPQYERIAALYQTAYHYAFSPAADNNGVMERIAQMAKSALEVINLIPVPVDSAIHAACTPFSTYCLVKDLCSTAAKQITWMDRYFDQTIFHRYFADVPATTRVTLITWPDTKCSSARDRQRHSDFVDVSRLFALERGATGYRLILSDDFHDRWLRCDDKLFALGGSIKDLGNDSTFTISKLDFTPENVNHFDGAIQGGREVFGTNNPNHP